jgi:hypothetical protein
VALTVSSAEATPSAVGSLTYGGQHLSTDDSGHLRTNAASANDGRPSAHKEVLTPVLATGVGTGPSKNVDTAPATYNVLYDPPGAAGGARRAVGVANLRTTRPSPVRWTDSHTLTRQQVAVRLLCKAGERPSPPNAGGRSGSPAHAEGRTATRLALPPSRMMNILEAEGRGRPQPDSPFSTTRLAVIVLGDRGRGTAVGLHDENP